MKPILGMFKLRFFLVTLLLLGLFTACRDTAQIDRGTFPPLPSFDSLLLSPEGVAKVSEQDSQMATLWGQLLGASPEESSASILQRFAADTLIRRVEDTILRVFPLGKRPDASLQQAFVRLQALLPGHPKPRLCYYHSGFLASFLVADSLLAVGLDRFLGAESSFYTALGMRLGVLALE